MAKKKQQKKDHIESEYKDYEEYLKREEEQKDIPIEDIVPKDNIGKGFWTMKEIVAFSRNAPKTRRESQIQNTEIEE